MKSNTRPQKSKFSLATLNGILAVTCFACAGSQILLDLNEALLSQSFFDRSMLHGWGRALTCAILGFTFLTFRALLRNSQRAIALMENKRKPAEVGATPQ